MRFQLTRASWIHKEWDGQPPAQGAASEGGKWFIEIESLDELMRLAAIEANGIVVSDNPPLITIYDYYLE